MTDRPMTQIEELVERKKLPPLMCSAGGVPFNKAHLDAKDVTISALRARAESAEAQVERMLEALEAVLPYAESAWDEGPGDEGWQSATLQDICTRARAALEPKP